MVKTMAKKIWKYLSKYKGMLLCTFICSLIGSVLALLAPNIIGKAIDTIADKGKVNFNDLKGYLFYPTHYLCNFIYYESLRSPIS